MYWTNWCKFRGLGQWCVFTSLSTANEMGDFTVLALYKKTIDALRCLKGTLMQVLDIIRDFDFKAR